MSTYNTDPLIMTHFQDIEQMAYQFMFNSWASLSILHNGPFENIVNNTIPIKSPELINFLPLRLPISMTFPILLCLDHFLHIT